MRRSILLLLPLFLVPAWAGPLERAQTLIDERRYVEARELLERTIRDSRLEAQGLVLLTRVCVEQEDYEDGIPYGERAVELLPRSSEAHLRHAQAVRVKLSKISKMKAMFSLGAYKDGLNRALELDPDNVDAMEEKIGYLTHAPGIAGGDVDEAAEWIAKLKRHDAERGATLEAELELKQGNEERALAIWREVLETDPSNARSLLNLGFWHQAREEWKEADHHFGRLAAGGDPQFALTGLYQQARTRVLGEYEPRRAIELLDEFRARLDQPLPGVASASSAWWRTGNAHEQLGDTAAARRAYETALELDPDNKEARKSLKSLR